MGRRMKNSANIDDYPRPGAAGMGRARPHFWMPDTTMRLQALTPPIT